MMGCVKKNYGLRALQIKWRLKRTGTEFKLKRTKTLAVHVAPQLDKTVESEWLGI